MLKAVKVRLYPTSEQELALAKSFGCARWYWNFALNACIQHYQETGKSLKLVTYKGMLPIDLGLKDFAIVHDGDSATKYTNPKHLYRHQKNLARKQKKLSRKNKGSKSREKFRKIVAKVHEKIANSRQDFLHKLSRNLVDESQIIVVENLNVKGMVKNRKLSKSISDVGWGIFVNFIDYKLQQKDGELIEIHRFFPSSKTCSSCGHIVDVLPLNIREWDCPNCNTHHDRDGNAALNIRNEGIRIKNKGGGNPVSADRACVRPDNRKASAVSLSRTVKGHRAEKSEAHTYS
ncbi:transposase (fragment) [Planktothrix serta PCC 8927]|uniref:Transposase n=1 Tax=Planktothrix serta PCC 8927 TaxID=671068 RepID=A0A7Z9BXM2_9CYAN